LFDLSNFQLLLAIGQSTPNILVNTTLVYGVDFELNPLWQTLTSNLGLNSQEQTYLIWLWLNTGMMQTFQRADISQGFAFPTQVYHIS